MKAINFSFWMKRDPEYLYDYFLIGQKKNNANLWKYTNNYDSEAFAKSVKEIY